MSGGESPFGLRPKEISFFQIGFLGRVVAHRSGPPARRSDGRVADLERIFEAGALQQPFELSGPARRAKCGFLRDDAALYELGQRLLEGLHPASVVRLHDGVDLLDLALADQVPARVVREENLECGDAASAVGGREQRLRDDALQRAGDLHAHLLLLLAGEDVDDAVDRSRRALRVQRAEHEVAGLCSGERGSDRFEVAHLADEDHVRVLAERGAQREPEARRVGADLALVDDAVLVLVDELDGILDREDVVVSASG